MKIVVVEPHKSAYVQIIDGELKTMQNIVGGLIQAVYPFADEVALVCNEEGKIMGLPSNRLILQMQDIIAGTFFVCGLSEDDFASLNDEQVEYYLMKYKYPDTMITKFRC